VAGTQKPEALGQIGCLSLRSDDSGKQSLYFFAYPHRGRPIRAAGFLAHLIDPSWLKGGRLCAKADPKAPAGSAEPYLPISLDDDNVKALARGQVQTMGQAGAGTVQTLVAILGGGGGVITALSSGKLSKTEEISAISVGGAIILVDAAVYLNRRTQNYITIFYNVAKTTEPELTTQSEVTTHKIIKSAGTPPPEEVTVQTTKAASAPSLFPKCKDFAVFQIVDPHDYWNTSMFLNAKTGLTFVDESATQGGKGGAAGGATPTSK
jgi:hypothetical protein